MPTISSWDALARAVSARPDSLRLAAAPTGEGANRFAHARWPSARPDAPYAVYLADAAGFRTLAFDIDRAGTPGAIQVQRLTELMRAAGVSFVEAVSGPTGHRHLITTWVAPLAPAAVAQLARALRSGPAPDLDLSGLLNPRTGCIRPPGSPHRRGGRSILVGINATAAVKLLTRGNTLASFHRLVAAAATPPNLATVDVPGHVDGGKHPTPGEIVLDPAGGQPWVPGTHRPLSHRTRSRLRRPLTPAEQSDRSAVAYSIAVAAANASWTFTDFWDLVCDASTVCLDHLRRARTGDRFVARPPRDVQARAERMWRSAVHFAATRRARAHPRSPAPRAATAAMDALDAIAAAAAMDTTTWAGQGGPGRRVVLEELLALGHMLGSTTVSRSVRDLETVTGLGKSSVARALFGLVKRGWLVRETDLETEPGREPATPTRLNRRATSYLLCVPDRLGDGGERQSVAGGTLVPAPQLGTGITAPLREDLSDRESLRTGPQAFRLGVRGRSHDVCTRDGLGRFVGLLLDLLIAQAADAVQLAERACLRLRTVRGHLQVLATLGLTCVDALGIWRAIPTSLARAAELLGVSGVAARRREQSRVERETWAFWLADFHAERGWATARGIRSVGRHTTSTGVPCPGSPFPVAANARRCWRAGTDTVRSGLGLTTSQLEDMDLDGRLTAAPEVPLTHPGSASRKQAPSTHEPATGRCRSPLGETPEASTSSPVTVAGRLEWRC